MKRPNKFRRRVLSLACAMAMTASSVGTVFAAETGNTDAHLTVPATAIDFSVTEKINMYVTDVNSPTMTIDSLTVTNNNNVGVLNIDSVSAETVDGWSILSQDTDFTTNGIDAQEFSMIADATHDMSTGAYTEAGTVAPQASDVTAFTGETGAVSAEIIDMHVANVIVGVSPSEETQATKSTQMVSGTEFNATIPNSATSVVFTDTEAPESGESTASLLDGIVEASYADGESVTDVSEAQDEGVVAWLDGGVYYVSTQRAGKAVVAGENMDGMFAGQSQLQSIDFNNLDMSQVTSMNSTFKGCSSLTGKIEINCTPTSVENCFSGTMREIVLGGNANVDIYEALADTAENNNVFYEEQVFSISYNLNGGEVDGENPTTYDAGDEFSLINPTKEGYTFIGWNGSNGDEPQTEIFVTKGTRGNLEYDAAWQAKMHSIAYNSNGGEGEMADSMFPYDTEAQLSANTFTKEGYSFNGWNTEADGTGTMYADGANVKNMAVDGCVTLYAQWKINTYSVEYNSNGGKGTVSNSTHTYNVEKTLVANEFTRSGYVFGGWNTKADGTGDSYADKESVKNLTSEANGIVTLYAQWNPILVTGKTLNAEIPAETTKVVFADTASDSAETDVSLAGDDGIVAWSEGTVYYVAPKQEGRTIIANEDCGFMFTGLSNLESVDESNLDLSNVTTLEETFLDCSSLTDAFPLPDGVVNMSGTFYKCNSLEEFDDIPDSVTNLFLTYHSCFGMKEPPKIGKSAENMYGTFYKCTNLEYAPEIPYGVTEMEATFRFCENLVEGSNIPGSATHTLAVYRECTKLESVLLDDGLVSIDNAAFDGCTGLTSITIPGSVTSIEPYAFLGCSNLTSVTFADMTTWYVGSSAGATDTEVDVTDASTNATHLKKTHVSKYWTKK